MNTTRNPQNPGASQSVDDSTALAALDVDLTEGTKCYNVEVDADFSLKVSNASLVTDQVVAVAGNAGLRWVKDIVAVDDGSVTNAKLANAASLTVKSNLTGGAAAPSDNTVDAIADALGTSTNPLVQTYVSAEIDLTATDAGGTQIIIPAKPGFFPFETFNRIMIIEKAGTLSTQPTLSLGADASFVDFAALASISLATAFTAGVGGIGIYSAQQAPTAHYSHTTPMYLKVTVAAAGSGLTLKVKFITTVVWLPAF